MVPIKEGSVKHFGTIFLLDAAAPARIIVPFRIMAGYVTPCRPWPWIVPRPGLNITCTDIMRNAQSKFQTSSSRASISSRKQQALSTNNANGCNSAYGKCSTDSIAFNIRTLSWASSSSVIPKTPLCETPDAFRDNSPSDHEKPQRETTLAHPGQMDDARSASCRACRVMRKLRPALGILAIPVAVIKTHEKASCSVRGSLPHAGALPRPLQHATSGKMPEGFRDWQRWPGLAA